KNSSVSIAKRNCTVTATPQGCWLASSGVKLCCQSLRNKAPLTNSLGGIRSWCFRVFLPCKHHAGVLYRRDGPVARKQSSVFFRHLQDIGARLWSVSRSGSGGRQRRGATEVESTRKMPAFDTGQRAPADAVPVEDTRKMPAVDTCLSHL